MKMNADLGSVPFAVLDSEISSIKNIRLFKFSEDGPLGFFKDDPDGLIFADAVEKNKLWPYSKENFSSLEPYLNKGPVTINGKTCLLGFYTFTVKLNLNDYNGLFKQAFKIESRAFKQRKKINWKNLLIFLFSTIELYNKYCTLVWLPKLGIPGVYRREFDGILVVDGEDLYISKENTSPAWLQTVARKISSLGLPDVCCSKGLEYLENLEQKPLDQNKIFYTITNTPPQGESIAKDILQGIQTNYDKITNIKTMKKISQDAWDKIKAYAKQTCSGTKKHSVLPIIIALALISAGLGIVAFNLGWISFSDIQNTVLKIRDFAIQFAHTVKDTISSLLFSAQKFLSDKF